MLPYVFLSPVIISYRFNFLIFLIIKVLRKLSTEIQYNEKMRHMGTNKGYSPENTVIVSYCVNIIID